MYLERPELGNSSFVFKRQHLTRNQRIRCSTYSFVTKLMTGNIYLELTRNATGNLIQSVQQRYEEGTLLAPFYR